MRKFHTPFFIQFLGMEAHIDKGLLHQQLDKALFSPKAGKPRTGFTFLEICAQKSGSHVLYA